MGEGIPESESNLTLSRFFLRKKAKAIRNAARTTKTPIEIPAMAPTEMPLELCDFGVGVGLGLALLEIAGSKISL